MQGIGMPERITTAAPADKEPELLVSIMEVAKAVEVVQHATQDICELLRVGLNAGLAKAEDRVPAPQPPLITERCMSLSELRAKLYTTNEQLQTIYLALKDI